MNTLVISAYESARERGESRCEAFCRAVQVYRTQRPDLPANRAGTEVARMLLAAARRQQASARNGLPVAEEMEYVEPV
jgi:hypothetical protein